MRIANSERRNVVGQVTPPPPSSEPPSTIPTPLAATLQGATAPTTTRTSSPITDPAFWETVAKVRAGTLPPSDEDPDEVGSPPCTRCNGWLFVRHQVPTDHPDFGKAFPCSCVAPDFAQRAMDRKLKLAGLEEPFASWTFESYRAHPHADLDALAFVERWAHEGQGSLLLLGPVGRGKTGLALPAFRQRIADGRAPTYLYVRSIDLFGKLWASNRPGAEQGDGEITDAIKECSLLLLDDLGVELEREQPSAYVVAKLYEIVAHRHEHRRSRTTIFTTNLGVADLEKKIERTYWRIVEMCGDDVYLMEGDNLRDRRRRQPQPTPIRRGA